MHLAPDKAARGDGVVGRRCRIIDADRIVDDLPIAGPRRGGKTEACPDAIDAGRRAAVAFDFLRLAGQGQMLEAQAPGHAGAAEHHRLGSANGLPGFLRRGAFEQARGAGRCRQAFAADQDQPPRAGERLRAGLRAGG
jgi:hypothetical protein